VIFYHVTMVHRVISVHCLIVRWCALQAQQQQGSELEKQSMEAGADREARQATGPEANDLRSASPCIPQQSRPVCASL